MKKNLTILEVEEKTTNAGKPYSRIKTDTDGWMACFDSVAGDHCKENIGKNVSVEVKQSGEYFNIAKFYGVENDEVEVEKVPQETKVSPHKCPKDPVGLAVEVFNELLKIMKPEEDVSKEMMQKSIDLVKQAQEAFK